MRNPQRGQVKSVRVPAARLAAFSGLSCALSMVQISKEVSCPQLGQETGISLDSEGFQVGPSVAVGFEEHAGPSVAVASEEHAEPSVSRLDGSSLIVSFSALT